MAVIITPLQRDSGVPLACVTLTCCGGHVETSVKAAPKIARNLAAVHNCARSLRASA
jgi:hypothetical protein